MPPKPPLSVTIGLPRLCYRASATGRKTNGHSLFGRDKAAPFIPLRKIPIVAIKCYSTLWSNSESVRTGLERPRFKASIVRIKGMGEGTCCEGGQKRSSSKIWMPTCLLDGFCACRRLRRFCLRRFNMACRFQMRESLLCSTTTICSQNWRKSPIKVNWVTCCVNLPFHRRQSVGLPQDIFQHEVCKYEKHWAALETHNKVPVLLNTSPTLEMDSLPGRIMDSPCLLQKGMGFIIPEQGCRIQSHCPPDIPIQHCMYFLHLHPSISRQGLLYFHSRKNFKNTGTIKTQ